MSKTSTARKPARKAGTAQKQPHDQELLDESLQETFPASDPIAPAVTPTEMRTPTASDRTGSKRQPDAAARPQREGAPQESGTRGPAELPSAFAAAKSEDLNDVYHALKRGGGRESVNDGNVHALIEMAMQYGDAQLERLLREWHAISFADNNSPRHERR